MTKFDKWWEDMGLSIWYSPVQSLSKIRLIARCAFNAGRESVEDELKEAWENLKKIFE